MPAVVPHPTSGFHKDHPGAGSRSPLFFLEIPISNPPIRKPLRTKKNSTPSSQDGRKSWPVRRQHGCTMHIDYAADGNSPDKVQTKKLTLTYIHGLQKIVTGPRQLPSVLTIR